MHGRLEAQLHAFIAREPSPQLIGAMHQALERRRERGKLLVYWPLEGAPRRTCLIKQRHRERDFHIVKRDALVATLCLARGACRCGVPYEWREFVPAPVVAFCAAQSRLDYVMRRNNGDTLTVRADFLDEPLLSRLVAQDAFREDALALAVRYETPVFGLFTRDCGAGERRFAYENLDLTTHKLLFKIRGVRARALDCEGSLLLGHCAPGVAPHVLIASRARLHTPQAHATFTLIVEGERTAQSHRALPHWLDPALLTQGGDAVWLLVTRARVHVRLRAGARLVLWSSARSSCKWDLRRSASLELYTKDRAIHRPLRYEVANEGWLEPYAPHQNPDPQWRSTLLARWQKALAPQRLDIQIARRFVFLPRYRAHRSTFDERGSNEARMCPPLHQSRVMPFFQGLRVLFARRSTAIPDFLTEHGEALTVRVEEYPGGTGTMWRLHSLCSNRDAKTPLTYFYIGEEEGFILFIPP